METTTVKFTLGGKEFTIPKPLLFGQLRVVEPLISDIFEQTKAKTKWSKESFDKVATIIVTAVGLTTLNMEQLDKLPTTSVELFDAFRVIMDASCMFKPAPPGAEKSGEASASIGDTSTQTSEHL